jgi:hypothetical protein
MTSVRGVAAPPGHPRGEGSGGGRGGRSGLPPTIRGAVGGGRGIRLYERPGLPPTNRGAVGGGGLWPFNDTSAPSAPHAFMAWGGGSAGGCGFEGNNPGRL